MTCRRDEETAEAGAAKGCAGVPAGDAGTRGASCVAARAPREAEALGDVPRDVSPSACPGVPRARWVPPFALRADQELGYDEAVTRVTAALCFGIDLTLETTQEIMAELGHPEHSFRSVQVAGTNGKTSTSRYTAALLGGEGLRVGLYTSPHLVSYAERMEVGGRPVSEAVFARGVSWALAAWERVQARNAEMARLGCTEFELLTAAAMVVFAEAGVEVAVLEVGLGGRWDATSAVKTCGCCVTGIGLDHMKILGDTLGAIAGEKAAVIHAGSPCVLGPDAVRPAEVRDVMLARCAEQGVTPTIVAVEDAVGEGREGEGADSGPAGATRAGGLPQTHVRVTQWPGELGDELACDVEVCVRVGEGEALAGAPEGDLPRTGAPSAGADGRPAAGGRLVRASYLGVRLVAPSYQAANLGCALSLATALVGRPLGIETARRALASCPTPGRFEVVRRNPLVLLDACHNPQSAEAFARALVQVAPERAARPTLLFATLADKDYRGIVRVIAPLFERIVVTQSDSPRALLAEELAAEVRELCGTPEQGGPALTVIPDAGKALEALASEPFVCCGTITLIGEVKGLLLNER